MKKILVIDDEETTRWSLKQVFKKDYDVFQAADGQEGVEMITAHNPDLVITDLTMPRLRGEEIVKLVKRDHLKTKVIVLTARAYLEPVAKAAGCDAFFEKPFDVFVLRGEVERLLGG